MNVSRIFASSIAAVSVVGAIGLAYAQTTTPPADQNPSTAPATTPMPATPESSTPMQSQTPSQPDSTINSTVNPPPANDAMATERAAQVDRN